MNKKIINWIINFVEESNAIEGIIRIPSKKEVDEAFRFIELDKVTIEEMQEFVSIYQPNAKLRDVDGLNVHIGSYYPPKGGKDIVKRLSDLLEFMNLDKFDTPEEEIHLSNYFYNNWLDAIKLLPINPLECHRAYEKLHPFTDCNGRSGRIIWLWQMLKLKQNLAPMGFLQSFYYQSLSFGR